MSDTDEPATPGGFDLGDLLGQVQAMQEQLAEAQAAAVETVVEGHAGGGVVTIKVNGAMEFLSVTIDPDAVDPADVEMLEDLVLAALHDAMAKAAELNQQALGGLQMPGLPGLPGLGP